MRSNPGAKRLLAMPLAVVVVALTALLVAGAAARTPVTGPWAGTWTTNLGTLTLDQDGSRIIGSYTHDRGRVVGRATGRTVTGTWSEYPTHETPGDAGTFRWTLDPSGKSFQGHWRHAFSNTWSGTWGGTLAFRPAAGVSWTGQWSSDWGTMTLRQNGSHVTGTYTFYGGRIDGTAIGRTLTGTWGKAPTYVGPPDAGPIVLQLAPSGLSFAGKWGYEGQTLDGSLTGTRLET